MTRGSGTVSVMALLVAVVVVSSAVPIGMALAAAEVTQFSVYQGGQCTTVTPLGNGTRTVEAFYDYRVSTTYSSHGTTHIQQSGTSQLFLYHGSGGISLVFLHDEMDDESGGGTITMDVSGLPSDREWVVEDDDYPDRDDKFTHSGTRSHIEWVWAPNRTDGGAVRGLSLTGDENVTIEPGFNEESDRWDTWTYTGDGHRVGKWIVRSDDGTTHELDKTASVHVSPGVCPADVTPTPTPSPTATPTPIPTATPTPTPLPDDRPDIKVSLAPMSQSTAVGGTARYDILVSNAAEGIGVWNFTVTVSNTSVGQITAIDHPGGISNADDNIEADGASVTSVSVGGGIEAGQDVVLATVTVKGRATGATKLTIEVSDLTDPDAQRYVVNGTQDGTLTVQSGLGDVTTDGNPDPVLLGWGVLGVVVLALGYRLLIS